MLGLIKSSQRQKSDNIGKLRQFQKDDPKNKKCADCSDLGPTYICMNFGTFICTSCSGLHRELSHRVKGISVSEWTDEEVKFILNHGNREAEKYLANCDSKKEYPSPHLFETEKWRQWIRKKYVEKKWLVEKPQNKSEALSEEPSSEIKKKTANCEDIIDIDFDMTSSEHKKENTVVKKSNAKSSINFFDFDTTPESKGSQDKSPDEIKNEHQVDSQLNQVPEFADSFASSEQEQQNQYSINDLQISEDPFYQIKHIIAPPSVKQNSSSTRTIDQMDCARQPDTKASTSNYNHLNMPAFDFLIDPAPRNLDVLIDDIKPSESVSTEKKKAPDLSCNLFDLDDISSVSTTSNPPPNKLSNQWATEFDTLPAFLGSDPTSEFLGSKKL